MTASFPASSGGVAVNQRATIRPRGTPLSNVPSWKRALDIGCIAASLPVWLPLMLLIALYIKVASPGPVLYRQQRIGHLGQPFTCLKFRSMIVGAETKPHEAHVERLVSTHAPLTKLDANGDNRLIPLGRLLRAAGLDELPQLFNVLRKEMSLVGPRPCMPYELKHFRAWQLERLNVLPGLTGYWQVNGKNRTTFNDMIAMDISYAKNLSPWRDIVILAKTGPAVMAQLMDR